MTTLETFNAFFDDAMNQKMSIHAFGMYAKGVIMNQQAELKELAKPKTCDGCSNFFENTIIAPCPWSEKRDGYCYQYEPKVSE
jgi:hypothetical protein